jgi:hypothetical protein
MLPGAKGETRRVTGHRWEEPNRRPPIPRPLQNDSRSSAVRIGFDHSPTARNPGRVSDYPGTRFLDAEAFVGKFAELP